MNKNQFRSIVKLIVEEVSSAIQELTMQPDPNLNFKTRSGYSGNKKYFYEFDLDGKKYKVEFSQMKKIGDMINLDSFSKIDMKYDNEEDDVIQNINYWLEDHDVWEISLERSSDVQTHSPAGAFGLQQDVGHGAIKVYSSMLKIIATFIKKQNPDGIVFAPAQTAQGPMYEKFVKRFLSQYNYVQLTKNPFSGEELGNEEFIFIKKGLS